MSQLRLFSPVTGLANADPDFSALPSPSNPFGVATDEVVDQLLFRNSPVAIGISGGKDSSACAWAVITHLNAIGHTGPGF